jgi:hypothetical protein
LMRIRDPGWKKFGSGIKNCRIGNCLGLHEGRSNYRGILQPSKENIWHFIKLIFLTFSFLWVIYALLDSVPAD